MQTSASHHQIGDSIPGGYRVIKVLRGGMGVVYICHQAATEQLYALKTVRIDAPEDEVAARFEKFRDEANRWIQISRESRSEQIVRALSFDADDQLLILEFIDGLPLNEICYKGPVYPELALRWARHIAEGMREIHNRFRLLHRDLKPSNVLITRRGLVAKITDFGIVKAVRPNEVGGTISGTPGFMAPESLQGVVDYRSDVYSYGATLVALLAGERSPKPEDVGGVLAGFDRKVLRLVERCMAFNPARRPQTFDAVLNELAEIEPGQFARAGQKFEFCSTHRFHSPSACSFCAQEKDLNERLLNGQLVVRAGTDATITMMGSAGAGEAGGRRRTTRMTRWVAAACCLAGAVALGWRLYPGRGAVTPPNPPDNPSRTLAIDVPAEQRCKEPGCQQAFVDPTFVNDYVKLALASNPDEKITPWVPEYCAEHSPYRCTGRCEKRFRERIPEICDVCGGSKQLDRVKSLSAESTAARKTSE